MKTVDNRAEFDQILKDPRNILLILFGPDTSKTPGMPNVGEIHDKAEQVAANAYRKVVWFTNTAILTADEKAQWCKGDDYYSVVSYAADTQKWVFKASGPMTSICLSTGEPSARKILAVFSAVAGAGV